MSRTCAASSRALFIFPVRSNTQLCIFMHLFGADLDLNGFATRPQNHGMNGLITVWFRVSDVIVKLIRQVAIVSVHYPQCGITIL